MLKSTINITHHKDELKMDKLKMNSRYKTYLYMK